MTLLALLLLAVVHADEFGQPAEIDFAGKVKDAAELRADAQVEVPVLRERFAAKDRSRFDIHGGVIEPNVKLAATGFFRVQELDGRFWFVTPEGHRFFLVGCDTSGFREGGYATPLADGGKARPEFERLKLPSYEELPQIYAGRGRVNFLAWNLHRKYGEKAQAHQDDVVRWRLSDWGFNSTTKWGWGWKLAGVPYIEDGHLDGTEFMFGGWPYGLKIARGRFVDMFHPAFPKALEASAKRMTDRRRGDRDLIAYSLENENGWNFEVINAMLQAEEGKAGSFARAAFREFLSARGKAPNLDLRGMKATDFDRRDVGDFIREASVRYHDLATAAFKRLDGDHLFYGESNSAASCREWIEGQALSKIDFIGMHEYNIEPLNWYRSSLRFMAEHRKPFAILEYSFTGVMRGMASYKVMTDCLSERARGLAYRHYTETAAQHPLCLGFGYFMMYDQPFTKRQIPGECHHFGLVSQQDRPYAEMIDKVKKSNARLFGIHAGQVADPFRLETFDGILKGDFRAAAVLRLFERESIPENVVIEADNAERAKLFHGLDSRLKINQDIELLAGVNNFGTIDLKRHPASTIVFKFFCHRGCKAVEWPVFEVKNAQGKSSRLPATRKTIWEGRGFDEIDFTVVIPEDAASLTVGIDVRDPARAWAALLADVTFGKADITFDKPAQRWLWGGFGFHDSEATMLPLMSDDFRDQRVYKTFREISPSYARVFAGFSDWTREAMDSFADYYDATFRRAGTTLYLAPGRMPTILKGFDAAAYAEAVAVRLEYLVKERKLTKIRYYTPSNELSVGSEYVWFETRWNVYREICEQLVLAFRRHGLDIGLMTTDSANPERIPHIQWATENLNDLTDTYCWHVYESRRKPGDLALYGTYYSYFTNVVQIAFRREKRLSIGEYGFQGFNPDHRDRSKAVMWNDGNYSYRHPQEAPLAAIARAEMGLAAMNAGCLHATTWTMFDYPDPFLRENGDTVAEKKRHDVSRFSGFGLDLRYNKNGLVKWCDEESDYSSRPDLYTMGYLTKLFRKGARVLPWRTDDATLRAGGVTNPDGSCSIVLINWGAAKNLSVALAHRVAKPMRVYMYDSAHVPYSAFNDLQPCAGTVSQQGDGTLTVALSALSMVFLTSDYEDRTPAAVTGVKRVGTRLVWTAEESPDHIYYRVYRDGRQVASTVATSLAVAVAGGTYTVRGVDRWGNEGAIR